MELHAASRQWAARPDDERFLSLTDMLRYKSAITANSRAKVVPSKILTVAPSADTANATLLISGANGTGYEPSHWAFGQLAQLAGAPAGYLRTLPAPLAADNLNYGLQFNRQAEEVGVLLQRPVGGPAIAYDDGAVIPTAEPQLVAATGPKYGRIWDRDVLRALVERFGNGVDGDFRVPGIFGQRVDVTKANTTLYAGDRDMFVFLADEDHRVEIPGAGRNGETEQLARGFFVWNSEVGSKTFGVATFLFRYACSNRIVWGAAEYKEIRIRHSSLAPERFMSEISPALATYANSSTASITAAVTAAQQIRLDSLSSDKNDWLATRFGKGIAASMATAHELEEGRPMESLWDAVQGATAVARSIGFQDERVALERKAGELLSM